MARFITKMIASTDHGMTMMARTFTKCSLTTRQT